MKYRAFALAALLGLSQGANAAISAGLSADGTQNGGSDPEVFAIISDTVGGTGETMLVDLGLNGSYDWTQDFATSIDLSQFTAPLTDLSFSILSGTFDGVSVLNLFFSAAEGTDVSNQFQSSVAIPQMQANLQRMFSLVNDPAHNQGTPADDLTTFTSGSGAGVVPNASGYNNGITDAGNPTIATNAALGSSLAFFSSVFTGAGVQNSTLGNGQLWTLSSGGQLTWASSVVPLPAGIWLFASVLLGLVGVSRRKVA